MKRKFFTFFTLIFLYQFTNAQDFSWVTNINGDGSDQRTENISVDAKGNSYTIGYFANTINVNGQTVTGQGSYDLYISKFDCQGNWVWTQTIGSASSEFTYGFSVFADDQGGLYATGGFQSTCYFSSANGQTTNLTSAGAYDAFVAKYDVDGNLIWAKKFGGSGDDIGFDVYADKTGHLYAVGEFNNTSTFGSKSLTSSGSFDGYVAKLDTSGSTVWAKKVSSTGDENAYCVRSDANDNVFVCGSGGYSGHDVTIGSITLKNAGSYMGYLVKFNSSGTEQWAADINSTDVDSWTKLALDGFGNVYVGGFHGSNAKIKATNNPSQTLSASNYDYDFAKFDDSGNLIWVKSFGSSNLDVMRHIAVSADGKHVYTTGSVGGNVTIGSGSVTASSDTYVITAFDSSGTYEWLDYATGASYATGFGMDLNAKGDISVIGFFKGTISFNSTSSSLTSQGGLDGFALKYCIDPYTNLYVGNNGVICPNSSLNIELGNVGDVDVQWYKDGNTINASGLNYNTSDAGTYYAVITNPCCKKTYQTNSVSLTANNIAVNLGPDTTVCSALTLDAGSGADSYVWNTGDTTQTVTASQTGWYTVAYTKDGCTVTDSVYVNVTVFSSTLPNSLAICAGSTATLDAGNAGASYLWSTTETTQTIQVTQSGTYSVIVSLNGCSKQFSCKVETINTAVNLGADTTICSSITLDAGSGADYYIWNTGATSQTITVSQTGWYGAVYYKNGCYGYDSIYVTNSAVSVNLPDSLFICKGSTATLDAGNAGAIYAWSDGSTNQTLVVDESGVYEVVVTNGPCTGDGRTVVTVLDMKVNLGADTMACSAYYLDAGNPGCTYLWDDGSTAQTRLVSNDGTYYVTVTSHGCSATDSINVVVGMDKPTITDSLGTLVSSSFDNNQWYKNGLEFAGATERTFNPPASGYYKVCVSNNNDCTVCSDSIYINVTGISSLQPVNVGLTVYPNPTQGSVQVKFNANERLTVELINAEGALVYKGQQLVSGDAISLQHLPNGIYLMRYSTSTAQGAMRLIKQ